MKFIVKLVRNFSWWQIAIYGTVCICLQVWLFHHITSVMDNIFYVVQSTKYIKEKEFISKENKYILLWDSYYLVLDDKHDVFPNLNCSVRNCIFTKQRGLLGGDYSNFDAILFTEDHLDLRLSLNRPKRRNSSQIYIFTTIESSSMCPACELYNDDFFNWTFTYRLDSDVLWSYFIVRDAKGNIVAPSKNVKWERNTKPIDEKIKAIIAGRTRAAAWIVSNCEALSLRDEYLTALQEHLLHYSLEIDVYGNCAGRSCGNHNECEERLKNDYFFYMAFENSISEDYITEKVLHGYNNYVVPILFGGANYSRFLPPGSYINARDYHPYNLAGLIYKAIKDRNIYLSYLGWTNLYTIDSFDRFSKLYHPLCDLCGALHSEKALNAPAKKNFRIWWNTLNGMKWCLPYDYWIEKSKINLDASHAYQNTTVDIKHFD